MKTPILIHIPEPCHENWDGMTPQDKGRHCQSCNKIVVDFSVMSDRQVLDYFKTTTANTCGRFHDDQLQRPLVEPQKQPSKWGYFLASFIGLIMSVKTFAQQKYLKGKVVGKPAIHRNITKGECARPNESLGKFKLVGDTIITKKDTAKALEQLPEVVVKSSNVPVRNMGMVAYSIIESSVKGKIVDERNNVVAGATIKIKDTNKNVDSDNYGKFELKNLVANNKLVLVVSSIGFETKEIELVPKDLKGELNIVLKESSEMLGEVIVQVPYVRTIKGRYFMGSQTTISCTKIKPSIKDSTIKIIQKIFNKESIKIYPNPATKNSIIHITIKDAGEYASHFFYTQSRLITAKKIITTNKNETTEFPLPAGLSSGNYFIRIVNEKTQKQVTEKLIIQ